MLRFLLVPLFFVQLFIIFGGAASEDTNASPGWDPDGVDATLSGETGGDARPGWDPNG